MTLVVSLRVPDGVVIAADSLQTSMGILTPGIKNLKTKDDHGRDVIIPDLKFPPVPIPTSTLSFAQKLFPFKGKFGVGTFGTAIINERTIYNHIKNLEVKAKDKDYKLSELADLIESYFTEQLAIDLNKKKQKLPTNTLACGFQIAGYNTSDDLFGSTIELIIGNPNKKTVHDQIGCTVSGDTNVVSKLWEIGKEKNLKTNYGSFSLQDAIDYVEFLINTTASFQRFANMIPTVGGAVDIALVTSYSNFNWVKYKPLTKILEKNGNFAKYEKS